MFSSNSLEPYPFALSDLRLGPVSRNVERKVLLWTREPIRHLIVLRRTILRVNRQCVPVMMLSFSTFFTLTYILFFRYITDS
jgi:hypothetical protein